MQEFSINRKNLICKCVIIGTMVAFSYAEKLKINNKTFLFKAEKKLLFDNMKIEIFSGNEQAINVSFEMSRRFLISSLACNPNNMFSSIALNRTDSRKNRIDNVMFKMM